MQRILSEVCEVQTRLTYSLISNSHFESQEVTEPFQLPLEYIELSQKREPFCYPQRHLSVAKSNTDILMAFKKNPKLKLFVHRNATIKVCRVSGEHYKCEQINEYKLDWYGSSLLR